MKRISVPVIRVHRVVRRAGRISRVKVEPPPVIVVVSQQTAVIFYDVNCVECGPAVTGEIQAAIDSWADKEKSVVSLVFDNSVLSVGADGGKDQGEVPVEVPRLSLAANLLSSVPFNSTSSGVDFGIDRDGRLASRPALTRSVMLTRTKSMSRFLLERLPNRPEPKPPMT